MAEEFNAQALATKAQSGDADAQYRLAALLMGEQQGDNALTWLRKAAANNHKDARFTLANFYMSGQLVSRDTARAAKMIIQLHEGGYGAASQMLSVMLASGYCVERDWQAALDILLSSAALGRSGALREVALLLILAGEDDALCHQLLMAAATRGDIHSAMILSHRHILGDKRIDAALAAFWCDSAKQMGHPCATDYSASITTPAQSDAPDVTDIPSLDLPALKKIFASESGMTLPKQTTLFDRPTVKSFKGLVPLELCHHLIGIAAPGMHVASELNPETGAPEADPQKDCMQRIFLPMEMDLASHVISARMAATAGMTIEHGEYLQILLYSPGQVFVPHLDGFEGTPESNADLLRGGQRVKSVLLYLNDNYEGGETHFCVMNEKVKGCKGEAIVIHNVLEDGTLDDQSVHEAFPTTEGTKWIASLYMREDPFVY